MSGLAAGGASGFSASAVRRWLNERKPGPETARLVHYWLSAWKGDRLPLRADFHPREIVDLLPSICIFDVVPEESVRARLVGSRLVEGAGGVDITGCDWLEMTAPADRPVRLQRFGDVARGAIGLGVREARRASGEAQYAEEIMLPFGDFGPGGARQVLTHVAWTPSLYDPVLTGIARNNSLLILFELTPLGGEMRLSA
ncbi:MAG TPA: PAS domain-containing protein [Rhizomicrobium sp.]|nr:PAS domain-containing protein [Rhizomicrobium sp.]